MKKTIDAALFRKMFLAGAKCIENQKEYINELNVFPVPDGDTGTNMTMTILSAADDVAALEDASMKEIAKAISSGTLRGARGNSGVILSQICRGFTKVVGEVEEINVVTLSEAIHRAVDTAYHAVMKPKEGTILTVAKSGAEKAKELEHKTEDIIVFATEVLAYMEKTLRKTPEMLPVLKEAGVVDSGGQGLITILQGAMDALLGKETVYEVKTSKAKNTAMNTEMVSGKEADIKFGYCTEFIILLEKDKSREKKQKPYNAKEEQELKKYLESIGDSLVVVSDETLVKVHVHTNHPGLAFEKALEYGALSRMKIDNMREEHREKLIKEADKKAALEKEAKKEPRKETGFISVAAGAGISGIFKDLGVDYCIEGGQTMNPSTEDMLDAIDKVNADVIFIFPNNGNIILAAEQAKSLVEDKKIIVIPSKTIPQGIAAMINFVHDKSPEENETYMTEEMQNIKSGEITYAVRDTTIDGKEIHVGDYMGIGEKKILSVSKNLEEVVFGLLEQLIDEEELVTLYYGDSVTKEAAEELAEKIQEKYPDIEIELQEGGQPVYSYLVSVE